MTSVNHRYAVPISAFALMSLTLALHWPGELNADSLEQRAEAISGRLTDWHPPLMAYVWSWFGALPESLLIIQTTAYWAGFALLALAIPQNRGKWRWLTLLLGLTPIGVHQLGVIQKDSLLAAFFVLAAGAFALTGRRAFASIPALFGGLFRINGLFAAAPFLIGIRHRWWVTLGLVALVVLALLPIVQWVNRHPLGAERSGVERTLQWFDLAGIAARSGDVSVLPKGTSLAPGCYTPLFWDSLRETECGGPLERLPSNLTGQWAQAIVKHPLAYIEHRLAYFNSTTFFLVPAMHQCVEAPAFHECDFSARGFLKDAVTKNLLFWPILWLVIGVLLLRMRLAPVEQTLLLSGLAYGFAYLVVGVAAQFRYFLWTELAVQIALMLHIARGGRVRWPLLVAATAVIGILGYAFRYIPLVH
jgi:hypothetical protein